MTPLVSQFFKSYLKTFPPKTVFTDYSPKEMMLSSVNDDGWFEWKLTEGNIDESEYKNLEKGFNVTFPKSFIEWHKAYFFLDGDCSILRLPYSNSLQPLKEIKDNLEWFIPQQIIPQKLYPFANEGNDAGVLVFDGRLPANGNEFPVRIYDHEYGGHPGGLSEIIFSSFTKLLECLVHYFNELEQRKNFAIIPDFFQIDPEGAGKSGVNYWLEWAEMQKANFEEFGY
jgi:hypothetical protein